MEFGLKGFISINAKYFNNIHHKTDCSGNISSNNEFRIIVIIE